MTSKWFILSNNVILISILYEEKLERYLGKEFLNFTLNKLLIFRFIIEYKDNKLFICSFRYRVRKIRIKIR